MNLSVDEPLMDDLSLIKKSSRIFPLANYMSSDKLREAYIAYKLKTCSDMELNQAESEADSELEQAKDN